MLLLVGIASNSIYAVTGIYQENSRFRNFMQQQAVQLTRTLAQVVSDDVRYSRYFNLWTEIKSVYKDSQLTGASHSLILINEIAVVDKNGILLAHTQADKNRLKTPYNPSIISVSEFIKKSPNSQWLNQEKVYFTNSPVFVEGEIIGYVLISFNTLPLDMQKQQMLKFYVLYQLVAIAIIIILAILVAQRITQPVNQLIQAIPNIGTGKLAIQFADKRSDEFKVLSDTLEEADKKIHQNHQEILEQKQKLSAILNNSDALIYMKDTEGKYLLVNHKFEQTFGLKLEDISGKTDDEILNPEVVDKLHENEQLVLKTQAAVHFEEAIPLKSGLHIYLTVKFPVKDVNNKVFAICGISTDITQRKKMEDELNQYRQHLESLVSERTRELNDALQDMKSFSYSVSHDLRTPLRSINGFSLALQEDYASELDDTATDYLSRIVRATDRMSEIIDNLLLLSRISRHEFSRSNLDLSQLAEKVVQQMKNMDENRSISIKIQPEMEENADPKLVILLLENLLGNAWKYTEKVENPQIEFSCEWINGEKVFCIGDNGAGFDMQYADKLFKPFQRLHGAEYEGTGIGLATVMRIIQRHNGKIWAESSPGKGARFYFQLSEQQPTVQEGVSARNLKLS